MGSVGSTKTTKAQRRLAEAVRGSLVADAACMGLHWIYDHKKLEELVKDHVAAPEFHEPPSCPFYNSNDFPGHYASGMPSPYGEEGLALIDYMSEKNGNFESGEDFAKSLFEWAQNYKGRKNHATKAFEENVLQLEKDGADAWYPACGADDAEANAFWKSVIVTARYADSPECKEKVEQAIRTHQNHEQSVEYGLALSKMLLAAANGKDLRAAIKEGALGDLSQQVIDKAEASAIESAADDGTEKVVSFVTAYSNELFADGEPDMFRNVKANSCGFPQSFVVGLKLCLDTEVVAAEREEGFDKFAYALRRNMLTGGDTCGRIPIIAGLMAAAGASVPTEWVGKTECIKTVDTYLEKVAKAVSKSSKV
ncbi:Crystallin J1A [Hondaea fermentalgiana]|uniref:Crystallin J1A n=1 Tax=Hondaea fermentalgiana TaxID=2315210 RepID=A0A2R5H0U5_9STRA|nr:Crystallin J1A [Hondaea fermentalgiana]|eukprot:GBG34391.1 Crystallin J1A [Hondaea fermentalgiana]